MEDIILLKVSNDTEPLVLNHKVYYSHCEARKIDQTSMAFIIGEKTILGIPLVASCTVKSVDRIDSDSILSEFKQINNAWEFEWQLDNIVSFNNNPYTYLKKEAEHKVIPIQTIGYISSEDVLPEILKKSNFQKKPIQKNNTPKPIPVPIPIQNPYKIGDIVEVLVGSAKKEKKTCTITSIKELKEQDVVYDQVLGFKEIENKFRATTLRKKEINNLL